jgi:site-specific DNA-methyltransferase (adenine-specific)
MTAPIITDDKYPISVLNFEKEWKDWFHPTQKPVELLKWLIKTYSNEGDVVLDNTAGSMSTAIAALETNRRCICIEKDESFFNIGKERVNDYIQKKEG